MSISRDKMEKQQKSLNRIRQIYVKITVEYGLTKLEQSFEQRCRTLGKERFDDKFLQDEAQLASEILDGLQAKAENRERVLEKFFTQDAHQTISEKYPILKILGVIEELNSDIAMLYSGMHHVMTEHWQSIKFYLEGTIQHHNLTTLSRNLSVIYEEDDHIIPYNIRGYLSYLENNPTHIQRLRRAQQILQEIGIWLNSLSEILALAKLDAPMPPIVEEAKEMIHEIVRDFRLKIFLDRSGR